MRLKDLVQFYGLSMYPGKFAAPDGSLHDDLLAQRKGLCLHLRQDLLHNLAQEIVKELSHAACEFDLYSFHIAKINAGAFCDMTAVHNMAKFSQEQADDMRDHICHACMMLLSGDPRGFDACAQIFNADFWGKFFGGRAWASIARAGKMLHRAKNLNDLQVAIDHVVNISHNLGQLISDFPEGEHLWIQMFADYKAICKGGLVFHASVPSCLKPAEILGKKTLKPARFFDILEAYDPTSMNRSERRWVFSEVGVEISDYLFSQVAKYFRIQAVREMYSRTGGSCAAATLLNRIQQELPRCIPAYVQAFRKYPLDWAQEALFAAVGEVKATRDHDFFESSELILNELCKPVAQDVKRIMLDVIHAIGNSFDFRH